MNTRTIIAISIAMLLMPFQSRAQVDDVHLLLRSGDVIEGDMLSYENRTLTMQYEQYFGEWGQHVRDVTRTISFDSVRTVSVGGGSSAATFWLCTLGGAVVGGALAVKDGGKHVGIGITLFGAVGMVVGAVASVIQSGNETERSTYSPAVSHDAELLHRRLLSRDAAMGWGEKPGYLSVRELVPPVTVDTKQGQSLDGWLVEAGDTQLVLLTETDAFLRFSGISEVLTVPYENITSVTRRFFARDTEPLISEWSPGESSPELLRTLSVEGMATDSPPSIQE